MERALVVANDFPYPLTNGGAIDTWGHIQTLRNLGFEVDMTVTVKATPSADAIHAVRREVGELSIVQREKGWQSMAAVSPFQVQSRVGLQTVPLSCKYEIALLEAEHVALILENPSLRAERLILRVHNNERRFFLDQGKSAKGIWYKVFYGMEALKFGFLSAKVMSQCDALWFISEQERKEHVERRPADSSKSFFVPPRVDVNKMRRPRLQGRKALFIGTLALESNSSAVEWYLSHVHPQLCDMEGYAFVVGGNTRGRPVPLLNKIAGLHRNVFVHENPGDLEELYEAAAIFVNPVLRGAGLKLKTIEAIQAGLPVVTTPTGVEGTGLIHGKHLLVADSAKDFATCVRNVFSDSELANALVASAQEFIAREYDQERIVQKLLSV